MEEDRSDPLLNAAFEAIKMDDGLFKEMYIDDLPNFPMYNVDADSSDQLPVVDDPSLADLSRTAEAQALIASFTPSPPLPEPVPPHHHHQHSLVTTVNTDNSYAAVAADITPAKPLGVGSDDASFPQLVMDDLSPAYPSLTAANFTHPPPLPVPVLPHHHQHSLMTTVNTDNSNNNGYAAVAADIRPSKPLDVGSNDASFLEPSTKTRKKKCPIFEDYYIKKSNTKKECIFCGKIITGQSITRIKRHWAGKCIDVLPCPNVLEGVRKSAMEDVQNWENRPRKEKKRPPGRLTDEGPSRPHDSLSRPAHDEPSRHFPSSQDHQVMALQPYNNDDTAASMEWAIRKWFVFNGLPYKHFFAAEFHQLYEAIVAAQRSSGLHVRPPVVLIDDEFILKKLEAEVDGYAQTVRSSWNPTSGCIVCFMLLDDSSYTVLAAFARCHQGTLFLRHERIEADSDIDEDKCKDFVDSIIKDVGMDNITRIFLRPHDSWETAIVNSTDILELLSEDMAYYLERVYELLFLYPFFRFSCYACFIVDICWGVEGLTTLREQLKRYRCDINPFAKNVALVSMMLNEKQTIDGLLGEMQQHHAIANLSFWNSEEAYEEVCIDMKLMLKGVKKHEPTLPTFEEINQGKQNMCKLIADIIAGEDIIPNSVFWKSAEAYICLFNHIHKTAQHMSRFSFRFENYLVAYLEAKSIIREEYFHKEDYRRITSYLDELLPMDSDALVCYSSPYIRQSIIDIDTSNVIKSRLAEIMGSDNNELEVEYASYCEKGNTCSKEVFSSLEIIRHPEVWWENQRDRFPHLHKLAIKTLSKRCSSNHIGRVIDNMYQAMSTVHNYEKLDYLLPIRLNNHFMHIATNSQDDNSALVGTEMANQHGDFTHQSFFDYFTRDVYFY